MRRAFREHPPARRHVADHLDLDRVRVSKRAERIEELELEPPELEAPDSPAEALGQKTPAND